MPHHTPDVLTFLKEKPNLIPTRQEVVISNMLLITLARRESRHRVILDIQVLIKHAVCFCKKGGNCPRVESVGDDEVTVIVPCGELSGR